jgi:hypothetical protein
MDEKAFLGILMPATVQACVEEVGKLIICSVCGARWSREKGRAIHEIRKSYKEAWVCMNCGVIIAKEFAAEAREERIRSEEELAKQVAEEAMEKWKKQRIEKAAKILEAAKNRCPDEWIREHCPSYGQPIWED